MNPGGSVRVKMWFLPEANVVEKAYKELRARGFQGIKKENHGSLLWEDSVSGAQELPT